MAKAKMTRKTATKKVATKAPAKRKVWKKRTATKKVAKKVTDVTFNPLATAFAVARKAVELSRQGELTNLSFLYKELATCCSARSKLDSVVATAAGSEGLQSEIDAQEWRHSFASTLFRVLKETVKTVEGGKELALLKERIMELVPNSSTWKHSTL